MLGRQNLIRHFATLLRVLFLSTRHALLGLGFEKARERMRARITAKVLDLEREMPSIRSFALRKWSNAIANAVESPSPAKPWSEETERFWDWALLELLVQSGLRIEEASDLTTLDILRRTMPDGSLYYLLHVKPLKFDRARVIPSVTVWVVLLRRSFAT